MRNISVMEQKQISGGKFLVKAYFWKNGQEDVSLRKTFYDEEEAWEYYYYLLNNKSDVYNVLQPQFRLW